MLRYDIFGKAFRPQVFFSGGGGGGGGGRGGGGEIPTGDCSTLIVTTTLNSPVPSVISTLHAEDILEVVLRQQGAVRIVVAQTSGADVAGSITSDELPRLVACLEEGFRFGARVLDIDGGRCRVQIRPVP